MYLLDINVLIGIIWTSHDFHKTATQWFVANRRSGWASCAMTQAGFVRISAQSSFTHLSGSLKNAFESLDAAIAMPDHRFLTMDFQQTVLHAICTGGIYGHRQITDAWLLATAVRHQCKLVTFDAGIRQLLATDAERQKHLVVLGR